MLELFHKYFNDECSPPEVKELLACFTAENESVLRAFITCGLEDIDVEDNNESGLNANTDKIFALIKIQLNCKREEVIRTAMVPVITHPQRPK